MMMQETMALHEYKNATKRTLPNLGSEQLDRLHMILGMNSEFNELYLATDEINEAEEVTDINWYATNYANLLNFDISKNFSFQKGMYYYALEDNKYIEMLEVAISKLTDLEKKMFAYKKQVPQAELELQLVEIFKRMNDCYAAFNIDPEVSMFRNIAKLKVRFPDKFNEEHANNRDLEKERKTLEGK